ncbi:MAG: DUF3549 family protein [Psychrobium sp.]|nr:DUF3549 family protein [Psychrobium sp.]
MDSINTLSEFLLHSSSQYRVFDMGRRVRKITTDLFSDFEHAKTPYPYPLQQHAMVGILFWNKQQSSEHYVWFLKLPLDERGLLQQASMKQFLDLVVNALGNAMDKQPDKEQQSALDHNPLIFKPSQQKLAAFNSAVRQVMKLPASSFMTSALSYLQQEERFDNWPEIGYQGFADVASRCDDPMFSQAIANALPKLPIESFCAVCCSLENAVINSSIADCLLKILDDALQQNDVVKSIHAARALSHSKGAGFQRQALELIYNSELISKQQDILVIIAARYWQLIDNDDNALRFLEAVAKQKCEQDIFEQLFSDLVAIPSARTYMLNALRHPKRSNELAHYIAKLITG